MAYEIKDWKQGGCSLNVKVAAVTNRERHSQEINDEFGEGGGLNANYATVEAVAMAANALGLLGYKYGVHFVFKTGSDSISFDFVEDRLMCSARQALRIMFGPEALIA